MQQLLDKLGQLPVLSSVAQTVIRSLDDPDIDATTLGQQISRDQVLSARLLRIANSAFYGLSRQVATPHDAMMVMGLSQVRSLVLAASLAHALLHQHRHGLDRKLHWQRSFRVASIAQTLARHSRCSADTAFTAGMLHNLGELVLDTCLPEAYAAVRDEALASGLSLAEAERNAFGFDHAEVGAEVARRWKLPTVIEHAIRHYHDPESAAKERISACIAVAYLLNDHFATGDEKTPPVLPAALHAIMPLDDETILACVPDVAQAEAAAEMLLAC
ncbi:MAG: HDOD domain-containing protein [Betaproteobacteria bacterium]|nr:HDOD domain-containing protein [Betaproteobacteria bacterium]